MSHSFTDLEGKVWNVNLTLAAARRVDQTFIEGGFDLIYDKPLSFLNVAKMGDTFFEDVWNRPGLSMFLVWLICLPQAEQMSQEEWAERMGSETINSALDALWEELMLFFPERKTALSNLRVFQKKLYDEVASQMPALAEDISEAIRTRLKSDLGKTLTQLGTTS